MRWPPHSSPASSDHLWETEPLHKFSKKGKRKNAHQINPKPKCWLWGIKEKDQKYFSGSFSSSNSNILNLSRHGLKLFSEPAISQLWERPFASVSWTSAHKHRTWGTQGHFPFSLYSNETPFPGLEPKCSFFLRCKWLVKHSVLHLFSRVTKGKSWSQRNGSLFVKFQASISWVLKCSYLFQSVE